MASGHDEFIVLVLSAREFPLGLHATCSLGFCYGFKQNNKQHRALNLKGD